MRDLGLGEDRRSFGRRRALIEEQKPDAEKNRGRTSKATVAG
jgi:hypothetical protein